MKGRRPRSSRPPRKRPPQGGAQARRTRSSRKDRPRPPPRPAEPATASRSAERLQKVLAAAGLGSRRQCEELIRTGRVEVDRQVVTELGTRVDPLAQQIRVDGVALPRVQRAYYAVHKPPGVVATHRDPAGRPRVVDLVPFPEQRLFPIGRLDLHSEGLILLTNDGALANRLTHPRYGVDKTYRVLVAGRPTPEVLARLRQGVYLAEAVARVKSVRVCKELGKSTLLEMVLSEGRNREIRRILARVGHKVLRLLRIAVGPIRLGDLPRGAWRRLTREEIEALARTARAPRRGERPHAKRARQTPDPGPD